MVRLPFSSLFVLRLCRAHSSPLFARRVNSRLEPSGFLPVQDLGTAFSDGTRLIQLVVRLPLASSPRARSPAPADPVAHRAAQESLTNESLGKFNYQPYLRVQKVENAAKALDRIKEMGVHLTNIGPEGASRLAACSRTFVL